jgi:hypothetical protein
VALTDDLKDYIARNSSPETRITERHDVAIVGEMHAFLKRTDSEIRTRATVRLLLKLLGDPKYRYFANESYPNKGPIRQGVRAYVQKATLPPGFDPTRDGALDLEEVARRVLVRRYQEVLDFLRMSPRYILSIGTLEGGGGARDLRLAQHFFEEFADRKLRLGIPGVLLLGAQHAAAVSDNTWPTVRMLLTKRGFKCVSMRVLTNFAGGSDPDDAVVPIDTDLSNVQPTDVIRLSSLVTKTPVTIATNRAWTGTRASPFQKITFRHSKTAVAEQFEYIVLQNA